MSGEVRPRIIGRHHERRALAEVIDRIAAGRPGATVVVEGPSGIGKTALVAEATARAAGAGCAVHTARVEPLETGRPLQLLSDLLDVRRRADRSACALSSVIDELLPVASGGAPALFGEPTPPPARLLDAALDAAEEMIDRPTVLVADDLHDADRWSIAALRRITSLTARAPLVVVAAAQPLVEPRLRRLLTAWVDDGAMRLRLGPLSEADALALAEDRHGGRVPAGLAAAVARAGGVPLLVVELVRSWRPGQYKPEIDLTAAVTRLVDGLDESTGRLVLTVASLGPVVPLRQLAAVLDADPLELTRPVEVAVTRGVLVDTVDGLRFGHELVRQAALGLVPGAVRRALHGRLAAVLAAQGADPLLVAAHRAESDEPVDPQLVERVVQAATRRGAADPRRALRLLAKARELDPTRSDEIDLLRLEPLAWLGEVHEAESLAERLLAVEAEPSRRVRLHTLLADLSVLAGHNADAVAHLDAAAAEPGAGALAPQLRAEAALARMAGGDAAGALDDAEAALAGVADSPTAADWATLALAASVRARVLTGRHAYAEGLAGGEAAVAAAERDPTGAAHRYVPWLFLGATQLDVDDVDGAAAALRCGLGRSLDTGTEWAAPLYQGLSTALAYRAARAADAVVEARVGLELADETGSEQAATWCAALGCLAALQLDDETGARRFLADAEARVATGRTLLGIDFLSLARAATAERDGDPAAALAELTGAWDLFGALDIVACQPPMGPTLVRLALAAGDRDRAEAVTAELVHVADDVGIGSFRARALHAQGMLDEDPDRLAAAAEAFAAAHRPLECLRARIARVGAVIARRGPRSAVPTAGDVVRAVTTAGLPGLEREVEREFARHGAQVRWELGRPPVVSEGYDRWAELTPTEVTVVDLVADGLSNAEIADVRGVSYRTIETHLHRAYRKLGLTSRTQLAVEAAARRA